MTLTQVTKAGLHDIALDHVFTIGASGSDHYTFQGEGLNGTVNDPTLYLTRGKTYRFENGSGGHPIRIQSTSGASGTAYNTGVTNNAGSGTVIVEVQHDAPDVLYYQCTSHANMNGILYITGALADGGVTTAKLADDAVTDAKLANSINTAIAANTAKSTNATHTGDVTGSGSLTIASGAVTTAKIADGNVTAAKLASGVQTTINNNADNRVITGSGTANTLNGESTLTFDGSSMVLGSNSSASAGATDLIIGANTSAHGLTIYSGYLDESTINFGDANGTGSTSRIGRIAYDHDGNKMIFTVNDAERLRITSGGMVNINDTSNTAVKLYVTDTNPVIASFHHSDGGTNDQARISLGALANNPPYNRGINLIAENNGAGHDFVVACSPSHSGGPAEKIRVKSSGGITFNGDTATANALDDYEEGSFTIGFNGATQPSWHNKTATYVKIGQLVHVDMWLQAASTTSSASMFFELPFVASSTSNRPTSGVARVYGLRNWVSQRTGYGFMTAGSNLLNMMWVNTGSNPSNMNMNLWQNGGEIHVSISYRTN